MTIKFFNHSHGGWFEQDVECLEDVDLILEEDEHTRLPRPSEIDRSDRDGMYTYNDLIRLFNARGCDLHFLIAK